MVWAICTLSLYLVVTVSGVSGGYCHGNNGDAVDCTCMGPPPELVIPPPLYPTNPAINNVKQPEGCGSVCIGLICFFLICATAGVIIAVVCLKKKEKMCFAKDESPGGHIVFKPSNKPKPADSAVHVEMDSRTNELGNSPKHADTNTMEKSTKITTQRQKSTDPLLQTERKNNLSDPDGKYEYKGSPEKLSPVANGETPDSPKKKKKKKKKKKHTEEGEDNPNLDAGNEEGHRGNPRYVQTTGRHANELPPVNHPHRVEPMEEHYRPLPIPPLQKSGDSSYPHA